MIKVCSPYTYGAHKRKEVNGSRHYLTESGQAVPSVTTILSATKDMTHLKAWRARVGEEKANQISKESTGLGSTMHAHLENYILGQPRPTGTNMGRIMAEKMADVIIQKGLCDVDEVWGTEVPLIYDTLWAGTTDLVGVHKGEPAIMDFKNTIRPKKREHVDDYRLQLTSYASCHNESFGTQITKLVIFMVSRDLEYQEFVWDVNDWEQNWSDWVNRVAQYYETRPLA
jgi:ATP-dependent exoDNAse (exonuclease V) beta subunit